MTLKELNSWYEILKSNWTPNVCMSMAIGWLETSTYRVVLKIELKRNRGQRSPKNNLPPLNLHLLLVMKFQ